MFLEMVKEEQMLIHVVLHEIAHLAAPYKNDLSMKDKHLVGRTAS